MRTSAKDMILKFKAKMLSSAPSKGLRELTGKKSESSFGV
jgi:hypothetical protein